MAIRKWCSLELLPFAVEYNWSEKNRKTEKICLFCIFFSNYLYSSRKKCNFALFLQMKEETEHILTAHGIHPTALRIYVYESIESFESIFSLHDVETKLDTMDTSTIFRCLQLFSRKKLIHEIDDGSKSRKYCLCRCHDQDHHDSHLHFVCIRCHKTYCVKEVNMSALHLPLGFEIHEMNCVAKGLCPDCTNKQN